MSVRSLVAVLLCMVTLFNFGVLGAQVDSRELTIANIPACGVSVLYSASWALANKVTAPMSLRGTPQERLCRYGLRLCMRQQ